jgi:Domain of unknown function (DUF5671)
MFFGIGYFIYSLISPKITMQTEPKTKALDVFVYVGIGIALVVSIVNILQILFTAIDRKFVDILTGQFYVDATSSDVRFAIASLVVFFPIYLGLSWYTSKDIQKFLYKQNITVRKLMIYLTLFVTVLTLIGTLVSSIYTYLGGEISVRFGLKALVVFITALSVFGYYYYSIRRDYSKKTAVPTLLSVIASFTVTAAVVWSISIIGTPSEMRAKKIDSTRLSDISRIQQEVFNRFQMTDKLPLTTSELNNAFQGYAVPVDPVTQEIYGYRVVDQPTFKMNYVTNKKELATPAIFELCATFGTIREYNARGFSAIKDTIPVSTVTDSFYSVSNYYYEGDMSPFWNHGIGETCFKRVITADMYYGK